MPGSVRVPADAMGFTRTLGTDIRVPADAVMFPLHPAYPRERTNVRGNAQGSAATPHPSVRPSATTGNGADAAAADGATVDVKVPADAVSFPRTQRDPDPVPADAVMFPRHPRYPRERINVRGNAQRSAETHKVRGNARLPQAGLKPSSGRPRKETLGRSRPPVPVLSAGWRREQAADTDTAQHQDHDEAGHRPEATEADASVEHQGDEFEDQELAAEQHQPEQQGGRHPLDVSLGRLEPGLRPVLGADDHLEHRLQQDGSEQ